MLIVGKRQSQNNGNDTQLGYKSFVYLRPKINHEKTWNTEF